MTHERRPAGWGPRNLNECYVVDLLAHVRAGWLTRAQAEEEARFASHEGEAAAHYGRRITVATNVADGTAVEARAYAFAATDDERDAAQLIAAGWLEWSTSRRKAYAEALGREAVADEERAELDAAAQDALAIVARHQANAFAAR